MRKLAICIVMSCFVIPLFAEDMVSVAAAANISSVAEPLSDSFHHKYPAYAAQFTFGASGALVTQILNGAPFQVFLSADTGFPRKLVDAGMTAGPVQTYAVGKLVLLTTKSLDLSRGLEALLDPSVSQVATCNAETAPYGRAALEALQRAGLYEKLKTKLVIGQTVTQALQFTLTSTDAGFVNRSALYARDVQKWDREGVYWIAVDPSLYSPITQGYVVMKSAASSPAVSAFSRFLLSPEAQAVFAAFGYGAP